MRLDVQPKGLGNKFGGKQQAPAHAAGSGVETMKIVQVKDYSKVAQIAGDGREQYPRTVIADTEAGDKIEIRGDMRAIWVRWAGSIKVRWYFIGVVGPDRHGSLSGYFVE